MVLVVDSSSVNVSLYFLDLICQYISLACLLLIKILMTIIDLKVASSDVLEITTEDEAVFFIRVTYLSVLTKENLISGRLLSEEEKADIEFAATSYSAEKKACEYLARAEQCRYKLTQKLLCKKYTLDSINVALDFLESKNLLSDRRYSYLWLRSRVSSKAEGRLRLKAELIARGIKSSIADSVLNDFFEEYSEEELCKRALQKVLSKGLSDDKIQDTLFRLGFSYKIIAKIKDNI